MILFKIVIFYLTTENSYKKESTNPNKLLKIKNITYGLLFKKKQGLCYLNIFHNALINEGDAL